VADIPGLPKRKRQSTFGKKVARLTTTKHWIESGPLVPWMMGYLQWLANEPHGVLAQKGAHKGYSGRGGTTISQKTSKAGWLAKRKISQRMIRSLETRPDVVAYFEKLREDVIYRAREMMTQDLAVNIEARREGLEKARADGDIKEVRQYTDWVPQVAFPKKGAETPAAPRMVIHIHGKPAQDLVARALSEPAEIQDVECEVLETKRLTDGEDDG